MQRLVTIKNNAVAEDFTDTADKEFALSTRASWQKCEQAFNGAWYLKGFAPKQSIEELKTIKLQEINNDYTKRASLVKTGTPEDEVLSWDIQKLEAQAYIKDNKSPTPFIDALVINRDVKKEWLINKVLEKVKAYESYIGSLTGKRQKYEDKIKLAKTVEDLNLIIWVD